MRWKAIAAIGGLGSNIEMTLGAGVGSLSVKVGGRDRHSTGVGLDAD